MRRNYIAPTIIFGLALWLIPSSSLAQDLDSNNYTLETPTIGSPAAGTVDSSNYSQVIDAGAIDAFTSTSTTYQLLGGGSPGSGVNVPDTVCLETDSNSATTSCTGLPGSDGMQAVCGDPGCYDRAKLEIDAQNNTDDTRYAIQMSTTSDFSANVYYVDPVSRYALSTLTELLFVPKCEWEGTYMAGICDSENETYQKYNILGLDAGTTYYMRVAAQQGDSGGGSFTQTAWGPTASTTTETPEITLDVDIAPNTTTSTGLPYEVDLGDITAGSVSTASDMIVFKLTSNAINGIETLVRGTNGGMKHASSANQIDAVNGDLSSLSSGFGLRNDSSTNSSENSSTLGSITVSTTPSDFSGVGGTDYVGAPTTTDVKLFSSNDLPLDTGITGYQVKLKPELSNPSGNYSETITFTIVGTF